MRFFKRAAIAVGLLVTIAAYVLAQATTSGTKRPFTPPPPTATAVVQFPRSASGTFVAPPPSRETVVIAAKVELKSGQTLTGDLHVIGPLECETIIGVTGIPVNTIRGIRQHDQSDEAEDTKAVATVVLANNDSLTVTVRVHHFEVKTEWGTAIINTDHVKSILLTIENVEWREAGGRWHLDKKDE
jgi:hypothetical protein